MELINRLPFPAMAFRQFDANGDLDCVVSVRGTFEHVQDGRLRLRRAQEDFQWEDAYDGDPHQGVLLRQTDLTPEKPGTDVTFLGSSYAPAGKPAQSWTCSLQVGHVGKTLRVHGRRFWHPIISDRWAGFLATEPKRVLSDWKLSETEPATAVSLAWSNAYGGQIPGTGDPQTGVPSDAEPANPLGCGVVNLDVGPEAVPHLAPSIVAADETSIDWRRRYEPQGFGPISPWWRQRQQYAGTYDDTWLSQRHPLLPEDFDPRFWQCAHPDLIAMPWLEGGEEYLLENLHPEFSVAKGALPDVKLGVHCRREDCDEWHLLNLDGVLFDWRSDGRVILTWRARFPLPDAGETTLTLSRVVLKTSGEAGRAAA